MEFLTRLAQRDLRPTSHDLFGDVKFLFKFSNIFGQSAFMYHAIMKRLALTIDHPHLVVRGQLTVAVGTDFNTNFVAGICFIIFAFAHGKFLSKE